MVTHDHHTLSKGEFKSNAGGHFSQAPPGHSSLAPKPYWTHEAFLVWKVAPAAPDFYCVMKKIPSTNKER
jgi:hypothetical protein